MMMKGITRNLFFFVAIFLAKFSISQEKALSTDSAFAIALDSDAILPTLIDAAINISPKIKSANSSINIAKSNLQISKNLILNALSFSTSYGYGNNVIAANNPLAAIPGTNIVTSKNATYHVGAGFYLPITQFLNRKNMIKNGKEQISITESEKDMEVLNIRQEVITMYQSLKLSHRILILNGKNKQSAQINFAMAEKNFLQGQLQLDQYSQATSQLNKALQEYEAAVNNFQTNLLLIESFTGVNLIKIISQPR